MIALSIMKFIIKTNKTTKKPKFKILTEQQRKARQIEKKCMELHKKAEENTIKKHANILRDLENSVDIKNTTIKHLGQDFQDKIDKLLDKLVVSDSLSKYFDESLF